MEGTAIFIHDIKLPETGGHNNFAKRFNDVSDLWAKAHDENLSEEDREGYLDAFCKAKYCLEQGIY